MALSFFIFYIFIFLIGLCIGSFLNCVIYRLEQKKSLKGRSFCPNCKHKLLWQDLFPVFSFLFLQGKCRYCHKKISIQYPAIEILTGLIFLLIFDFKFLVLNHFEILNFINLAFLFYIASAMIVIFVYDLKCYIIPDKVLLPAIAVTFLYSTLKSDFSIINLLLAVAVAAGFFLLIFLISKGKWMGFGDVKLAILMGLLLGLPNVLVALFLAFFFGAVIGVILMIFKKKNFKSEIPFGPFLILGTFVALFWGQAIANWYFSLSA